MENNNATSRMEPCELIKFLVNEDLKPTYNYINLEAQYVIEALSRSKTFKYYKGNQWC